MALEMHATIRLDTDLTDDLPDNEYRVSMTPYQDLVEPVLVYESGITGKLMVHRQMTGSTPDVKEHHRFRLIMTRAEKDLLKADVGKKLYFMPHYRDEADPLPYRDAVLFAAMGEATMYDPQQGWWRADITLVDATGLTVDT